MNRIEFNLMDFCEICQLGDKQHELSVATFVVEDSYYAITNEKHGQV